MSGAQVQPSKPGERTPPAAAAPAPTCTLVIFGAHGDLTKRLLVPALYNLVESKLLADGFRLVGIDRVDGDDDRWRHELRETMEEFTKDPTAEFYTPRIDASVWDWLASRARYIPADFTSDDDINRLKSMVSGNVVFYCAVAARFSSVIGDQLGKAGLLEQRRRVPPPRRSVSRIGARFTNQPARSVTWCRTTCSRCFQWSRPSRRTPSMRRACAR